MAGVLQLHIRGLSNSYFPVGISFCSTPKPEDARSLAAALSVLFAVLFQKWVGYGTDTCVSCVHPAAASCARCAAGIEGNGG